MTRSPGKPYASANALRAAIVARANTATRADPRFTVQERLRQFAYARLLADPQATMIVVEHRDRLARFGVEHLEAVLSAQGRRLVVLDPRETTDDLVRDMIDVLTSFCARLYGRRGARHRALRAVACARKPPGQAGDAGHGGGSAGAGC